MALAAEVYPRLFYPRVWKWSAIVVTSLNDRASHFPHALHSNSTPPLPPLCIAATQATVLPAPLDRMAVHRSYSPFPRNIKVTRLSVQFHYTFTDPDR